MRKPRSPTARSASVDPVVADLKDALARLCETLRDVGLMEETPLEVQDAIERAVEAMAEALRAMSLQKPRAIQRSADAPTPRQGQFLAYIHQYVQRNHAGVAPTHAALQRFFNLTAPSVNSMLVRLEQRGFIRRTPGKARGITLTLVDPSVLPELERPFQC